MQMTMFKQTHKSKVLSALKQAGKYGQFSYELAQQEVGGFRFSEYIRQLRSEGHNITTHRVSGSTFKYYLTQDKEYTNE